ncbi:MAG: protein translocase subunit SecF [Patescibacteria group bacterium]
MLQIIPRSKYWLTLSGALFVVALLAILIFGFKSGLDFSGGNLLELKFLKDRPTTEEVKTMIDELKIESGVVVQPAGDNNLIIRFQSTNEDIHKKIVDKFKDKYKDDVQEERFDSIGAAIGTELKTKAIYSIIMVSICIIIYVAWAFRKVSWPVASWKYGLIAVIALIHDVTIVAGIFAILGKYAGVEVDLPFIAALLTILGYSVNDTIIIFDRIRENLGRLPKTEFGEVVNRSLNETMARSINTTFTTLLAIVAVLIFGGASISAFALALTIGIFLGAYSSIFVASPLLVVWNKINRRED